MPAIPTYHTPDPSPPPSPFSNTSSDKWGPYTNSGDFTLNMLIILAALLTALGLALAINSLIRYIFCHRTRRNRQTGNSNPDLEKPAVQIQIPETVYKAGNEGDPSECPICLSEFVDGDRVRVLPLCGHGFHVRCIEKWINGGGSCPTCRARVRPVVMKGDVAAAGGV